MTRSRFRFGRLSTPSNGQRSNCEVNSPGEGPRGYFVNGHRLINGFGKPKSISATIYVTVHPCCSCLAQKMIRHLAKHRTKEDWMTFKDRSKRSSCFAEAALRL